MTLFLFVLSHPFDRKKSNGWATEVLRWTLVPAPNSLLLVFKRGMMMALPTHVPGGLVNGLRDVAEVGRDMVLEALAANEFQQLLQLRNLGHAGATKCFERIDGELAGSSVAAHDAVPIVGGVTRIAHGAGLDAADAGAEGVLLTHGAGNDLLIIHADVGEKVLGKI